MDREELQRIVRQGHTGWWDNRFGKRIVMNVPNSDGSTREVSVTESWMDLMIAQGVIQPDEVTVHIKDLDYAVHRLLPESLRPKGSKGPQYSEQWNLRGKGIATSVFASFYDSQTKALYAVRQTVEPQQGPKVKLIQKSLWDTL